MMTEAYLSVEDLKKYYGEVRDQIGSISQVMKLMMGTSLSLEMITCTSVR